MSLRFIMNLILPKTIDSIKDELTSAIAKARTDASALLEYHRNQQELCENTAIQYKDLALIADNQSDYHADMVSDVFDLLDTIDQTLD